MSCKVFGETVLGGLINLGLDSRNCRGLSYVGTAAVLRHSNGYLHIFVKLTVKQFITTAMFTALI